MSFPPLHPASVHFPIALIVFSVLVEFIAYFRPEPILKQLAKWTLVGACIGGVIAVAAGLIDINRLPGQVGFAILTLLVGLTVWRWFIDRMVQPIPKLYLFGAGFLLLFTIFQGWLGGELVFSQGIAVAPTENRIESPEVAQARLKVLDSIVLHAHQHGAPNHASDSHGGTAHGAHRDAASREDNVVAKYAQHGSDIKVDTHVHADGTPPYATNANHAHQQRSAAPKKDAAGWYNHPEGTSAREPTSQQLKQDGIFVPTSGEHPSADHEH